MLRSLIDGRSQPLRPTSLAIVSDLGVCVECPNLADECLMRFAYRVSDCRRRRFGWRRPLNDLSGFLKGDADGPPSPLAIRAFCVCRIFDSVLDAI